MIQNCINVLTHPTAEQVVHDMNRGEGRPMIDKLTQFYSPTHPKRDLQRLSPMWRREHRYDEAMNNCQDFAQRLATSLDTENPLAERPTAKKKGRLARFAYWSSQVTPTLPQ